MTEFLFITLPVPSEGESSMELEQNYVHQQLRLHTDEDMEVAVRAEFIFRGSAVGKCCREAL